MTKQRRSWTTKPQRALVFETIEEAALRASVMLGRKEAILSHLFYSSSQKGWVIFNEANTKMIADR